MFVPFSNVITIETIVDEHILHALMQKLVYHVTLFADAISL